MNELSAIILAAGLSSRMGRPKMILPWGEMTIIETVMQVLCEGGLDEIVVVTGGWKEEVETSINRFSRTCEMDKEGRAKCKIITVHNPNYTNGEMITSLNCGLRSVSHASKGAMIALGDNPQIQSVTVRMLREKFLQDEPSILQPVFNGQPGHPWIIHHRLWEDLLSQNLPYTLRDFQRDHQAEMKQILCSTPTITQDVDTPEEYQKFKPHR